jgi:hypothetical protein
MPRRYGYLGGIHDANSRLYRVLDDLAGVVLALSDELSGDQGDEFCGGHLRHGVLPPFWLVVTSD